MKCWKTSEMDAIKPAAELDNKVEILIRILPIEKALKRQRCAHKNNTDAY